MTPREVWIEWIGPDGEEFFRRVQDMGSAMTKVAELKDGGATDIYVDGEAVS